MGQLGLIIFQSALANREFSGRRPAKLVDQMTILLVALGLRIYAMYNFNKIVLVLLLCAGGITTFLAAVRRFVLRSHDTNVALCESGPPWGRHGYWQPMCLGATTRFRARGE